MRIIITVDRKEINNKIKAQRGNAACNNNKSSNKGRKIKSHVT